MNFFSRGRTSHALVLIWLSLLSGCVTYTPKPIDWGQEQKSWQPQNAEPMTLTLGDLIILANVANPEINRVRMRHATLKREAHAAGWWEDPSLDVEVSRLLKGGGWTRAAGVSLVIPLTGIPGLERKAAEAYAGAGAFEVLLAEKKLEADVREAWVELGTAESLAGLYEDFDRKAAELAERAEALARIGELPREEAAAMRKSAAEARALLVASRHALPQARAALLELAGIHPAVDIKIMECGDLSPLWVGVKINRIFGITQSGDKSPHSIFVDESDLISHPAVMAKLAEFNATEQELQIEIKKQWPEVSLGPTIEHDGELKGGLAFGVTLPLWNRNRAGIASAEGLRDEARQECIDVWRSLVYASHRARSEIEALEAVFETAIFAHDAALENVNAVASLDALGETDLQTQFESLQMMFETMERCLELEAELAQAKIRAKGEMLMIVKE